MEKYIDLNDTYAIALLGCVIVIITIGLLIVLVEDDYNKIKNKIMKSILSFLDSWGVRLMTILVLLILFKTCNTNTYIRRTNQRIDSLSYVIKKQNENIKQLNKDLILEIKLEGLKTEKRMIQSTDRKILDVNRQSEIDKEINELSK